MTAADCTIYIGPFEEFEIGRLAVYLCGPLAVPSFALAEIVELCQGIFSFSPSNIFVLQSLSRLADLAFNCCDLNDLNNVLKLLE